MFLGKARVGLRGGLRLRLVVGFAVVAVVSALTTGALTFREARTGVLQQSQDAVVKEFRDSVDARAPGYSDRPDQSNLDAIVKELAWTHRSQQWRFLATYGDLRAVYGPQDSFDALTPELLRSVRTRPAAVFQRVRQDGRAYLVVGLPVCYAESDGAGLTPSGLVLYLVAPQKSEQLYVNALVTAIERAVLPALGLAVLLALLVARGVLRPVRALGRATRRMAAGHLDTRLAVSGSDELAELSRTFNDTAAALEESVAELRRMEAQARRFAADVSHELRTPLAAMTAVTDVLDEQSSRLDRVTGQAVRLVSEETSRLARLVDDLMEISRFDAGAAELALDDIDVAESVRRTLAARGWPDRVATELPAGPLRARVDPRRLDVVVANLVGNALRHGAPPVTLRLAAGSARLPEDGWVVITVTDQGPGVPEAALPHVFERFYKASGPDPQREQRPGAGHHRRERTPARRAHPGGQPSRRRRRLHRRTATAPRLHCRHRPRPAGREGRRVTAVLRAARAGLAVALLSVTGCGVPTSGVIDAGAPATGVPTRTTVYFLADSGLRPVPRQPPSDDNSVAGAVRLLLAGPTPTEARTLTTALPPVRGGVDVTVDGDIVTVRFPAGVDRLRARAMTQLTCTVAEALGRSPARLPAAEPSTGPPAPQGGGPGVVRGRVGVRAVGTAWKALGTDADCPVG